jgi:hypothetical protein
MVILKPLHIDCCVWVFVGRLLLDSQTVSSADFLKRLESSRSHTFKYSNFISLCALDILWSAYLQLCLANLLLQTPNVTSGKWKRKDISPFLSSFYNLNPSHIQRFSASSFLTCFLTHFNSTCISKGSLWSSWRAMDWKHFPPLWSRHLLYLERQELYIPERCGVARNSSIVVSYRFLVRRHLNPWHAISDQLTGGSTTTWSSREIVQSQVFCAKTISTQLQHICQYSEYKHISENIKALKSQQIEILCLRSEGILPTSNTCEEQTFIKFIPKSTGQKSALKLCFHGVAKFSKRQILWISCISHS